MKHHLLIIPLLLTLSLSARSSKIQVGCYDFLMGYCLESKDALRGNKYVFSDMVEDVFVYVDEGLVTAMIRKFDPVSRQAMSNGRIIQYDLINSKTVWSKRIGVSDKIDLCGNSIVLTRNNSSRILDAYNGTVRTRFDNNFYHFDEAHNIGLGYSSYGFNELEGIDMNTSQVLWKRKVNRDFGWNDSFYANDATLIVVAGGIHAINIKNGNGWSYETKTGKKDYTGTIAANLVGLALGLLTGTYVVSYGHSVVHDLVSNLWTDSTNFYLASTEQIAKIDNLSGRVFWKNQFGTNEVGASYVFKNKDVVCVINRGFGFMNGRYIRFGKPFIAAYNDVTGAEIYKKQILTGDEAVTDFYIRDNNLFLLLGNRMMKFAFETGTKLAENYFPEMDYGELTGFAGDQIAVVAGNGKIASLKSVDSTSICITLNRNRLLAIDTELQVVKTPLKVELCTYFYETPDFKFYMKNGKAQVANNDGRIIAELNASNRAFMIGTTLYDIQDNALIVADLKEMFRYK